MEGVFCLLTKFVSKDVKKNFDLVSSDLTFSLFPLTSCFTSSKVRNIGTNLGYISFFFLSGICQCLLHHRFLKN